MEATRARRPIVLTILAVLATLGGLYNIWSSIQLLQLGSDAFAAGIGGMVTFWAIAALIQGVLSLGFGAGTLFGPQSWAWTLGVASYALSIILSVVAMIMFRDAINMSSLIIQIVIAALILFYLFTANVRQAYTKA